LSDDLLLGLWQRAFSYYLVDCLTREGERRDDFQLWLTGFSVNGSATAQLHFPTEADWQRELADATSRSRQIVFTWDETAAELDADDTITYTSGGKDAKDAKVMTCTLETVATVDRTSALTDAIKQRIFVLTELELRAHPGWHDILECYRAALTALVEDPGPERAKGLLAQAGQMRAAEVAHRQKLVDYVNWFEVTKDYSDAAPQFDRYFKTAQEMERVQADPAHPNPIRANLLQIESEL